MIDLVLDDLRGETSECGMALAELAIRIRDLNALEADRAALAFERQAAFGGVVGAVFRSDRRVEHYEDATAEILVHECNDALRDADHVCGHADAAIAMCVERVLEILCDGKILGRIERLRRRLAQKRNGRHDFTLHVVLPLAGSFAGLPTLYGVIVRRRTAMERMTGSRLSIYEMSHGDFEMWDRNRRNMLGTMDDMPQYRKYMTQALELAHKGAGWVNPNPLVGMVVVRDGEILAAGYHDRYRGPHAERMAFDYADKHGIDMHGATVIDTLEPCCHVGSQPACTDLILSHGITRVVVGSIDPNPIVAGKGLRILEETGVEVVYDVMRAECDAINRHFFHYITTGMPYIVDGRKHAEESDAEYAVRRRGLYDTYAAVLGICPTGGRAGVPGNSNGTEGSVGSAARLPGRTDQLDVSDGAFAHFDGPVQAVDANEVVVGRHKPLHLDIRALADTEPDEWLRELGRRKIDSLVVDDDDVFEMLSSI